MDTWRTEWIEKKQKIALSLNSGDCGSTYGEAALILCSVLSALAAEVWPGRGIDRNRFIELIKKFSPSCLEATKIGIPILVEDLYSKELNTEGSCIKEKFLNYDISKVLTGDKVDRSEAEILEVCDALSLKELRECNYPNLLYKDIRSSYTHGYQPSNRASSWPMTGKSVDISYFNILDETNNPQRCIHFHFDWIAKLAIEISKAVDIVADSLPRETPSFWWIEGEYL